MIVNKTIGPVVIGRETFRFLIGDTLRNEVEEYFRKTGQLEQLIKSGVLKASGELKSDESIRTGESGQPGHSDEDGRTDSGDDGYESTDNRSDRKRNGKR